VALAVVCWQSIRQQLGRLEAAAPVASPATAGAANAYPGALALSDGVKAPAAPPVPSPLHAKEDKGDLYRGGCIASLGGRKVRECTEGPEEARLHIVLVGDSHAVHWWPALQVVAAQSGARLTAITKSACAVVDIDEPHALENYGTCMEWSANALERVQKIRPDVVVFAHSRGSLSKLRGSREASAEVLAASFARVWARLEENGATVFAIRDTPAFAGSVPDCLGTNGADCRVPRAR